MAGGQRCSHWQGPLSGSPTLCPPQRTPDIVVLRVKISVTNPAICYSQTLVTCSPMTNFKPDRGLLVLYSRFSFYLKKINTNTQRRRKALLLETMGRLCQNTWSFSQIMSTILLPTLFFSKEKALLPLQYCSFLSPSLFHFKITGKLGGDIFPRSRCPGEGQVGYCSGLHKLWGKTNKQTKPIVET